VLYKIENHILCPKGIIIINIKNKVKDMDFRKIQFFNFENKKKINNNGTII